MEPKPKGNELKAGLKEEELLKAIASSGYPLQHRVALILGEDFEVSEEWGYSDRETNEPRSLDLAASRTFTQDTKRPVQLSAALLVECKRSDLPVVFFRAANTRLPRNYPRVFGFNRNGFSLMEGGKELVLRYSEALRMEDFAWVSKSPPVCRSMARIERKGKDVVLSGEFPFREAVMPLVHAMEHWDSMHEGAVGGDRAFPSASFLVTVLDAPMVVATGPPENVTVKMEPWVRLVRQESEKERFGVSTRNYVIDFVHVEYLVEFLKQHMFPFMESLTERVAEGESVLLRRKGVVKSLDEWTWKELLQSPAK